MSGQNAANSPNIDVRLDITGLVCPVTFVKTQAVLEDMEDGQALEIRLNDGEPIQNVPRTLKDDGHRVLRALRNDDGTWTLVVVKQGLAL
jgi:TusA-related sulfurtransferase